MDCTHQRTELRYRIQSDGRKVIMHQCLDCGHSVGAAVSQKDKTIDFLAALKPWDAALVEAGTLAWKTAYEKRGEEIEQRRALWWAWYNEYLRSTQWLYRRERVLERDKYICQGCHQAPAVQVHHLTYAHVGNELLFELTSLCRACHETAHAPNAHSGPPPPT